MPRVDNLEIETNLFINTSNTHGFPLKGKEAKAFEVKEDYYECPDAIMTNPNFPLFIRSTPAK
jgi:hypothetical protein